MNIKNRYVVGIGEALWDILPTGKQLGGAPANFAYHAAKAGCNAIVISALGDDALGKETMETFKKKNIQVLMPCVSYPTGTVQVTLDGNGIPQYNIKEGAAWDYLPFNYEMKEIANNCCAVCWGTLAQRNKTSHESIIQFIESTPKDCIKIFDINLRQHYYTKEIIERSLILCDILKINDEELNVITKLFNLKEHEYRDICRELISNFNLNIVVLTCGTNGSYVYSSSEESFCKTPKVDVADTVGAGDSFTGSFCVSILKGETLNEAHKRAVQISAFVCTKKGAMPEYDI